MEIGATFPVSPAYVFTVVVLYPISLTPRFSEVHGRIHYHNRFSGLLIHQQKTAEAVGVPADIIITQLKQGVNESFSRRQTHTLPLGETHAQAAVRPVECELSY